MSHHQESQSELQKGERSQTSNPAPKIIISLTSPSPDQGLRGLTEGEKSSVEVTTGVPEGIPPQVFSFANCVLVQSVSEGPAGRREILFQENDISPVKGQTREKKEESAAEISSRPLLKLEKFESAPEIQEVQEPVKDQVKELGKSPSHTALTSLLNLILKEQMEYEQQREKLRAKTPERVKKPQELSINLVNKFTALQKNSSHNSSHASLHERSGSNLLSFDQTTEKSSRTHTEPPSKMHSRVGSQAKINVVPSQPEIIWETCEVESASKKKKRTPTCRLSADYSYLVKQFENYPALPVERSTSTLSSKRMRTEDNTPMRNAKKTSTAKPVYRSFISQTKNIQAKLFSSKPSTLKVKETLGRWKGGAGHFFHGKSATNITINTSDSNLNVN